MIDWMLSVQNDIARLPSLVWQQGWLCAGWSVVIAWLGAWFVGRWTTRKDAKVAIATCGAVWVGLPGSLGGAYWLGMAFQAPSVTTVLLCALLWLRVVLWPAQPDSLRKAWPPQLLVLALCGAVLGWALLLDTLGVFSGSLYHWGFGAAAPGIALSVVALPWVIGKKALPGRCIAWLAIAILCFVVLRLPTGNLFDALLDPWLWFYLQFALIQQWTKKNLHSLHRTG